MVQTGLVGDRISYIAEERFLFRVSIVCAVKEDIDPEILQRAVNLTMPRFRRIKRQFGRVYSGDIWNRMTDPALCAGGCKEPLPAHAFKGNNRYLVRIYYYRNRIALEAHHSLGDGTGGMCVLQTLTATYLRLKGHSEIEMEDSYWTFWGSRTRESWKMLI